MLQPRVRGEGRRRTGAAQPVRGGPEGGPGRAWKASSSADEAGAAVTPRASVSSSVKWEWQLSAEGSRQN